eukprot:gnl/Carplike_NY0171/5109_a6972_278.p1 GENE.gnl/Carplike_NY0171/5109_a6972_278~~gnl/Carplike_NY0171/5109_a6972_278.p1  ORF type:complete len:687 (+),score=168.88 gnl/Carplike_NY0171/5109_a6972_278:301-2061(+)
MTANLEIMYANMLKNKPAELPTISSDAIVFLDKFPMALSFPYKSTQTTSFVIRDLPDLAELHVRSGKAPVQCKLGKIMKSTLRPEPSFDTIEPNTVDLSYSKDLEHVWSPLASSAVMDGNPCIICSTLQDLPPTRARHILRRTGALPPLPHMISLSYLMSSSQLSVEELHRSFSMYPFSDVLHVRDEYIIINNAPHPPNDTMKRIDMKSAVTAPPTFSSTFSMEIPPDATDVLIEDAIGRLVHSQIGDVEQIDVLNKDQIETFEPILDVDDFFSFDSFSSDSFGSNHNAFGTAGSMLSFDLPDGLFEELSIDTSQKEVRLVNVKFRHPILGQQKTSFHISYNITLSDFLKTLTETSGSAGVFKEKDKELFLPSDSLDLVSPWWSRTMDKLFPYKPYVFTIPMCSLTRPLSPINKFYIDVSLPPLSVNTQLESVIDIEDMSIGYTLENKYETSEFTGNPVPLSASSSGTMIAATTLSFSSSLMCPFDCMENFQLTFWSPIPRGTWMRVCRIIIGLFVILLFLGGLLWVCGGEKEDEKVGEEQCMKKEEKEDEEKEDRDEKSDAKDISNPGNEEEREEKEEKNDEHDE